jgi:hypothetical protein
MKTPVNSWKKWLETTEAKTCLEMPVTDRKYLENRLWAAFTEGEKSASFQIEDLTKEVERLKADVEVLLNNVDKHSDQLQKKLDHARFDIDTCLFIQKSKKLKD